MAIRVLATPVGVGGALVVTVSNQVLAGGVPTVLVGTASGLPITARQIGGAIAAALTGVIIARADKFSDGFSLSLAVYVALSIVAIGVTMLAFQDQLADDRRQSEAYLKRGFSIEVMSLPPTAAF